MRRKVDFSGSTEQLTIFEQLVEERRSQDRQWGGPDHDDEHTRRDWLDFLKEHTDRARKLIGRGQRVVDLDAYRQRLIVIVALGVAAIEAHDRDVAAERANEELREVKRRNKAKAGGK